MRRRRHSHLGGTNWVLNIVKVTANASSKIFLKFLLGVFLLLFIFYFPISKQISKDQGDLVLQLAATGLSFTALAALSKRIFHQITRPMTLIPVAVTLNTRQTPWGIYTIVL